MIKITFAAALFVAAINATEVEVEVEGKGKGKFAVESTGKDDEHVLFKPKHQPYEHPKQTYCDIEGLKHQEHLDTLKY